MKEFKNDRVVNLIQAIDDSSNEQDAESAFHAVREYLNMHGKGFKDFLGLPQSSSSLDLGLQGEVIRLTAENENLRMQFSKQSEDFLKQASAQSEDFRKQAAVQSENFQTQLEKMKAGVEGWKNNAKNLRAKLLRRRLKTMFASAVATAGLVGITCAGNYGLMRHDLSEEFKGKEGEMTERLNAATAEYILKKGALYDEFSFNAKQDQAERQEKFDKNLAKAKADFQKTLEETQPYRLGVGQLAYVSGLMAFLQPKIYSADSTTSKVLARMAPKSCVVVTGVSNNGDMYAVEQTIQGVTLTGFVEQGYLELGDVGKKVDCLPGKSLLGPQ